MFIFVPPLFSEKLLYCLLIKTIFYDLCRNTNSNSVRGNIFCYYRTGTNDSTICDRDTIQYRNICTDKDIIAYGSMLVFFYLSMIEIR